MELEGSVCILSSYEIASFKDFDFQFAKLIDCRTSLFNCNKNVNKNTMNMWITQTEP